MESGPKEKRLWIRFREGKLTSIILWEGFSLALLRERWSDLPRRIYLVIPQKRMVNTIVSKLHVVCI